MIKKVGPEQLKLREDIAILRNKVNNVDEQIVEEEKIKDKIRSEAEEKHRQIRVIEEAILAERKSFRMRQKKIKDDMRMKKEDKQIEIDELVESSMEVENSIAGIDIIEQENQKLHQRIKDESQKLAAQTLIWQEEIENLKRQNFDVRVKLEEVFRSTIKMFDKGSRLEAKIMMESEAAIAEFDNAKFLKELSSNEIACGKLSAKHQRKSEDLSKLKVEKEVIITGKTIREKEQQSLQDTTGSLHT